jgi:prophage regulatory protein
MKNSNLETIQEIIKRDTYEVLPNQLDDSKALQIKLKTCKSNIYKLIETQGFPRPLKIGRASRWIRHEVDEWLDSIAANRSPKTKG